MNGKRTGLCVSMAGLLLTSMLAHGQTIPPLLLQRGTNWLSFPPTNSTGCFIYSSDECPLSAFYPALDHAGDPAWLDWDGNLYTVQYTIWWTNFTSFGFEENPFDTNDSNQVNGLNLHLEYSTNSGETWHPLWFVKQGWVSGYAPGGESNYVEIIRNAFGESLGTNSGCWISPDAGVCVISNQFQGMGANTPFQFDRPSSEVSRLFRLALSPSEQGMIANGFIDPETGGTNIDLPVFSGGEDIAGPITAEDQPVVAAIGVVGVILVVVTFLLVMTVLTIWGWKKVKALEKVIMTKQQREREEGDSDETPPAGTNQ